MMRQLQFQAVMVLVAAAMVLASTPVNPTQARAVDFEQALSVNLTDAQFTTKALYHLFNGNQWDKELAEEYVQGINTEVEHSQSELTQIKSSVTDAEKPKVEPYLNSLERHLTAIGTELKTLNTDMAMATPNFTEMASTAANMYFDFKDAETVDHKEVKSICSVEILTEPMRPAQSKMTKSY